MPPLREPLNSGVYRAVQLLTAAAALAWCLWQRRRIDDPRRLTTLVLAMGLGWLMLFGPAVEHPSYVFLAPVLNWALLERDAPRPARWFAASAFVLVMLLGWDAIGRAVPAPGAGAAGGPADRHDPVHLLADLLRSKKSHAKSQRTQRRGEKRRVAAGRRMTALPV